MQLHKTKLGLLIIIVLSPFLLHSQDTNSFVSGFWKANLQSQNKNLPLILKITKTEKDSLNAVLDSPLQSAYDIPVTDFQLFNDSIRLKIRSLGVNFKGKINFQDSTITGLFKQSIFKEQLVFHKTENASAFNRPQEPKPPYNYVTEEIVFENKEEHIYLSGTLTYPDFKKTYPAVVLISGSGPQNRDEELLGHKPFLVLSDYLTKAGFAVLRFDDRGVAKSEGIYSTATTYDFAKDVEAAVDYLKKHPNVDSSKITLIGHSEGGMIAPYIASYRKDLAAIVLMAGPGTSGEQILISQTKLIYGADKIKTKLIDRLIGQNKKIYSVLRNNTDNVLAQQRIKEITTDFSNTLSSEERKELGISPAQNDALIQSVITPWFRSFISLEPSLYLKKVKQPVLAINGSLDLQVPADENLKAIKKALKKARNKNFEIKKLIGLNHLFQHAKSGSPDEYSDIEETISPEVLQIISDWLTKTLK